MLHQKLPLQIMPIDENPEGKRFAGLLRAVEKAAILVDMEPEFKEYDQSDTVHVEFIMKNFRFSFDTEKLPDSQSHLLHLVKPQKIHRSVLRKAERLLLSEKFTYTIWTEQGLHEAELRDISANGIRFETQHQLAKNTLLSVNVYLRGQAIRFICQAIVRWCVRELSVEPKYICGALFTTLSREATERLSKFISEQRKKLGFDS